MQRQLVELELALAGKNPGRLPAAGRLRQFDPALVAQGACAASQPRSACSALPALFASSAWSTWSTLLQLQAQLQRQGLCRWQRVAPGPCAQLQRFDPQPHRAHRASVYQAQPTIGQLELVKLQLPAGDRVGLCRCTVRIPLQGRQPALEHPALALVALQLQFGLLQAQLADHQPALGQIDAGVGQQQPCQAGLGLIALAQCQTVDLQPPVLKLKRHGAAGRPYRPAQPGLAVEA